MEREDGGDDRLEVGEEPQDRGLRDVLVQDRVDFDLGAVLPLDLRKKKQG